MLQKSFPVVSLISFALCGIGSSRADDPSLPSIKSLTEEVQKLVLKHYPKATIKIDDGSIQFEFNTRKFMIHNATKTGEWQNAYETVGPQRSGIWGSITIVGGAYQGAAVMPHSFDVRYFVDDRFETYSKKWDVSLSVSLRCPKDVPEEFRKEFAKLVTGFEKHLTKK